jgi:DNA-binding NtrC family response regulator
MLSRYHWPGNIRELENLVERMVLFASGSTIRVDELPDSFLVNGATSEDVEDEALEPRDEDGREGKTTHPEETRLIRLPLSSLGLDLKEAVRAGSRLVEETLIREALQHTDGNVTRSARLLGISRRSLQSKMKELGLRTTNDGDEPST